jgi:phosphonate transport system ATP-binding protein
MLAGGHARNPIEASAVTVRLGVHDVVRDVSFVAGPGHVVALLGSNGAGKTTLFRALLGLVPIVDGAIVVDGTDVVASSPRALRRFRRRVGFVPQRLGLVGPLSALGNVLLGRLGHGTRGALPFTAPAAARRTAMAALARVDMADLAGRPVAALSGGQQQRVAIARMLVQEPAVILADEPVASLDPWAAESIMGLLRGLADEGHTVVVTLHQLHHVDHTVDQVVGLRDGRVLFTSPACDFDAARAEVLYGAPA